MEEVIYETKKNLIVMSNRSGDKPHICTSGKFCILGLPMYFDSAYRDVLRAIHQHNFEPIFGELFYCQFRHDGMSHENSIKEVNIGEFKNKIGELGTYLRTFLKLWNELIDEAKNMSVGSSESDPILTDDSDDSDYNESDMDDTTGWVEINVDEML